MNVFRRLASLFVALGVAAAASAAYATEVDLDATSPSGSSLSLGAGTYDVSEIAGTYVSANLWADGGVGSSASGGPCDTPSSCRYGFRPTFDISINGAPATSYSIPVAQGAFPATYDTAADALAAFQTYQAANPISFTLNSASTVNFFVPDGSYSDNSGGVSLSVVSAAPEPAAWMLMIFGVGGIGLVLRRAKALQGAGLAETGAA
jgi:hypothetical protein